VVHEKVSVVEDSLNPRPQGWLIFGSLAVKDCLKGAGAGLTRPGGLGQGTSDLQVMSRKPGSVLFVRRVPFGQMEANTVLTTLPDSISEVTGIHQLVWGVRNPKFLVML
jgi:hypothetical protein